MLFEKEIEERRRRNVEHVRALLTGENFVLLLRIHFSSLSPLPHFFFFRNILKIMKIKIGLSSVGVILRCCVFT